MNKMNFWSTVRALNLLQEKEWQLFTKRRALETNDLFIKALSKLGFTLLAERIEHVNGINYGCTIYNMEKTTEAMKEEGVQYGFSLLDNGSVYVDGFVRPTEEEMERINKIIKGVLNGCKIQ